MAVNYKMYQDNRKESKTKGKWFARATHKGVVETNQLTEVMTDMLQQSMRIKLNGLGTFKIGISTRAAETAKDFTITKHLRNVHVLFQPELTVDRSSHARKRADRKSTRLNSSHANISYAVFCLKKKKITQIKYSS